MQQGRREIFALGELAVFVMAWMLAIGTALSDYQGRTNSAARDNVAARSSISESLSTFE
jgi:hypothetical protein